MFEKGYAPVMAPGLTSSDSGTQQRLPRAHYRTTGHGTQVVLVPTRCPAGFHVLANDGYRIRETDQTLHISCQACVEIALLCTGDLDHECAALRHSGPFGRADLAYWVDSPIGKGAEIRASPSTDVCYRR
jgi:hypothetical protein